MKKRQLNSVPAPTSFLKLIREPLAQFFAIGVFLFALYGLINQGDSTAEPGEIVIDEYRVTTLAEGFQRTWQRPPTRSELGSLVDNWIREEILFREGLALQLDKDDPIVRRRVAQKMEFISDELVAATPDDAALQTWLNDNSEDYVIPARYSLRQVYFDPSRHDAATDAVVAEALEQLATEANSEVGDPTLLPTELDEVDAVAIARSFGSEFAAALELLPVAQWSGPIVSGYGLHIVYIESKRPARQAQLDEVRPAVERDLLRARSAAASEAVLNALQEKYGVTYTNEARELLPDSLPVAE